MQLTGLHHVTAITAQASKNLAFYTQILGLRLVKKTVNQDDVSAYHLFYADAFGSPGTEVTFFDWPQTAPNRNGAGSIAEIGLRVPSREALEWWARRLAESGVPHKGIIEEGGRDLLRFSDPEGQALALVNDRRSPGGGTPWDRSTVPVDKGIRGLNSVKLMVQVLEPTAQVLTGILGFRETRRVPSDINPSQHVVIYETGPGGPGSEVHVEAGPHLPPGRLGRGGVHHVAFRTPNAEEQREWRQRIYGSGLNVTDVIDRFYFKSIYFRIPGGMLFEIATDGPGFDTDEDMEHLGERLALPPFLEPQRQEIESQLRPLEIEDLV
ncbi:MAG: ring-cleaving dioxygenase [Chloroflexi bacterium]|nr:MAG: ring-cleaving dioxygenase [Chloroflexota bacterium]